MALGSCLLVSPLAQEGEEVGRVGRMKGEGSEGSLESEAVQDAWHE
jgi:hypothetical protein